MIGVLAIAVFAVDYLVTRTVDHDILEAQRRELVQKGQSLGLLLRGDSNLMELARSAGARITWIAPDGRVLAESDASPNLMENHRNRPEVIAALQGKVGSDMRRSATLGESFFYVAVPYRGGALRLSIPAAEIEMRVNAIRGRVFAAALLASLPALLMALMFARYVSSRLGQIIDFSQQMASGNLRARLPHDWGGEFGVLSARLNETSEKLEFLRRRLESEQLEMEKLEQVRKDFVANVSHELRTPLASIQGYTETLLDGALEDPEHNVKFLNIIRDNAQRLTRLTADLLVLSRVEQGQQKFYLGYHPVNRLLSSDLDMMRPLAERKSIRLDLEAAPEPAHAYCDPEAVHQILANLLDNAIKYTPDGGRVTVGARMLGKDRVELFVRDSGIGIPPQELPRLFERFYRVDKARSRAMGGTGLGLAIVKHLTRAQGGDVRVESKPDHGSTFYFTLPVRTAGESPAIQRQLTVS
jgi:two-component system phosphate regulon sensor histidine kinase PhoR